MAVTATHLTTSFSTSAASSYNTASISPSSNKLIVACIWTGVSSGTVNVPTCSGNGVTWVKIAHKLSADNLNQLTMFRAMGSPSSGAITFDFSAQTQNNAEWTVSEFGNVDTTGSNGSGAVKQSASNTAATTNTGITVTLSSFTSTSNATHGVVGKNANNSASAGSGFTELGTDSGARIIESEWRVDNDTSVDWTWGSENNTSCAIAIEIAIPTAGSGYSSMNGYFDI